MITLTAIELEWIISALNTQAEECRNVSQNQDDLAKALMRHRADSLDGIAAKVANVKQSKVKRIAITR